MRRSTSVNKGTAGQMFNRPKSESSIHVLALTADGELERVLRATFGADAKVALAVVAGTLAEQHARLDATNASVLIVDLDPRREGDLAALEKLAQRLVAGPPIIAVMPDFDQAVARRLLQMRIADFVVKPAAPLDLVRACARAAQGTKTSEPNEARIYTFLPAAGGVGLTTLAIETAMLMLRNSRGAASTCLVDLDFQHGSCADYLDVEPRLDLDEIEPRPERLDRQLLEVMLSQHSSGLSVIAAPNRPAEMRSFDFEVVTRLLDLVAAHFTNVVIDVPRTWFGWTDSVLIGSNRLFIVTEMTVPGLRHAKQLVDVIRERLTGGPKPEVVVNRFEQALFGTGLRRADIEQVLGESFAGTIPNNYGLVREAIDRGVPLDEIKSGNNVSAALKKLIAPPAAAKPVQQGRGRSLFRLRPLTS